MQAHIVGVTRQDNSAEGARMIEPELPFYPHQPGYRREGTSRRAAEAMKPRAPTLRDKVIMALKVEEMTADETAAALDKSILSIRPRFSEALALGLIADTGRTRANDSGVQATVWRAL